jgi:hypothetical protein
VYGLGGWWQAAPWQRILPSLALIILLGLGIKRFVQPVLRQALVMIGLLTVPYLAWIGFSHDVDLARYTLPLVAAFSLLVGMGLPQNLRRFYLTISWVSLSLIVVTVPLAIEHQQHRPLGQQLAEYMNINFQRQRDLLLFGPDLRHSTSLYIGNIAPGFEVVNSAAEELEKKSQIFALRRHTVYTVAVAGKLPRHWEPVAHLVRNRYMESREVVEVWIYRYNPAARAK